MGALSEKYDDLSLLATGSGDRGGKTPGQRFFPATFRNPKIAVRERAPAFLPPCVRIPAKSTLFTAQPAAPPPGDPRSPQTLRAGQNIFWKGLKGTA